jgi:integrase
MKGHIRRRSAGSFELKYELPADPLTGHRDTRYASFKGTKRAAEARLVELMSAAERSDQVETSKVTVAEFLRRWESEWVAGNVSPKSAERYSELARLHVVPHLGAHRLQRLKPEHLTRLYAQLLREGRGERGGLHPRTVGHVHRIVHLALRQAVTWQLIASSPASFVKPPRVENTELEILTSEQVNASLRKLRGRALYRPALVAVATGVRRGELLALRWCDLDLDSNRAPKLRVEQSLEQTKKGRLRFKPPKTRHGRRAITLPVSVVAELRAHRLEWQQQRLALGGGKLPPDGLVFGHIDGTPRSPNGLTKEWSRTVKSLELPDVTFHALRHTHASQLIASGMDVLTISRRLGHGSPTVTLTVYGHLFANTDDRAAALVEAALAGAVATD